MSSNKQSSVDWLSEQTYNAFNRLQQGHLAMNEFRFEMLYFEEQAKEMHRKEIEEAFDFGDYNIDLPDGTWEQKYKSPEQYYNEVFGGNK